MAGLRVANEKIEGWFRACETAGLDGSKGVLIPQRTGVIWRRSCWMRGRTGRISPPT